MKTIIKKIAFIALFAVAGAYILFLVGEYLYWFIVNPQNKTTANFFAFALNLATQALCVVATITAIKNKKGLSLGLFAIPLLLFAILLFAPNSTVKSGFSDYISQTDKALYLTNFSFTLVLFLLCFLSCVLIIVDIIKSKFFGHSN